MSTKAALVLSLLAYMIALRSCATHPGLITPLNFSQQINKDLQCTTLVSFNNVHYVLEDVHNISGIPADISIHWKTGNVFFTLISEQMKMSIQVLRPNYQIEPIRTEGLGQSTAIDNVNDIVYLATDNGVYVLNENTSAVELYKGGRGEDVMYIGVNSDGSALYIATWPQNKVHIITNEGRRQLSFAAIPNGHGLTIDTKDNIYFVASKTTYVLKSGDSVPIRIKGLPIDKMTGVFVSISGKVYVMDDTGNLYIVDVDNASAKVLGAFNISGVNAFGMDRFDNMVIGIKDLLLRYNVYETNPCSE